MSSPSMNELNFASVRTAQDLKHQTDILNKIAHVKMDQYLETAPEYVKKLHDKGVPKEAIFGFAGTVGMISVVAVLLFYGLQILAAFVSVVQPLYYTYKALETDQKDDDTVWLTYWMVFGVLYVLESTIFYPIVELLPAFYFGAKMLVQIWMVNFEGSTVIYQRFIAPFLRKHEKQLEQKIVEVKEEILEVAGIRAPAKGVEVVSPDADDQSLPPAKKKSSARFDPDDI